MYVNLYSVSFFCSISGACFDHELQPGNSNRIYLVRREPVGVWAGIYVSEDGGYSWQQKDIPPYMMICGRLAVSQAPGDEDYVYALVTCDQYGYDRGPLGGTGTPYVLLSTDAGNSWEDKTVNKGSWHWSNTFSPIMDESGGQGYFDMMIGVSASNPAHVLFGVDIALSFYRGGYM